MAACLYLDESKVGLVAVGTLVGSSSHQPYSALLDFLNKSHTLEWLRGQGMSMTPDSQESSIQVWQVTVVTVSGIH